MSLTFPLIYCNGDSYSDEHYHHSYAGSTYAHIVGKHLQGLTINKAIAGSCNRRIIRSTLYDLIEQRRLNPDQQIIALIGLSFEIRSELWIEDIKVTKPEESNFRTHTFSDNITWREQLLTGKDLGTTNKYQLNDKFFEYFSKGRAYFYSPYAERINLLADLIMLKSTMESLNIDFLIFQSPAAEKLENDHLLNFFKQQIAEDPRFFDFEEFGFCDWCLAQGFTPLDYLDRPEIGHYKIDAHAAFANKILIPKLQELNII